MHALLEDCRIEPCDSGSRVIYTMHLDPIAPLQPNMKMMGGLMRKQLDKGMQALATRAEGR